MSHQEAVEGRLVAGGRDHISSRPQVGQMSLEDEGRIIMQKSGRPQVARQVSSLQRHQATRRV